MTCAVASAETAKTNVYENLKAVTLPTFSGEAQILSGHAEAFMILEKGTVVLENSDGKKDVIQIDGGSCYIKNDEIAIIL